MQIIICQSKYPDCHCNECLDKIQEYHGFKKGVVYKYKGEKVTICSICSLKNCCHIFIQGIEKLAYCEWLNCNEIQALEKVE